MRRCVRLSFPSFSSIDLSVAIAVWRERSNRVGQRCHSLFLSFFFVSWMRMVKWKLVTIAFLILIISIYFTGILKRNINYLAVHQPVNPVRILVFIHIQKTAGSEFERAIVRRLSFQSQPSCQCPITIRDNRTKRPNVKLRCNCTKDDEPWLISRFSVGWLCGVHADWMNYHRCLPVKMNSEYGFHQRK